MKKWYQSKTMLLQTLQTLQLISGLVTTQYFPDMTNHVAFANAVFGIIISKATMFVRNMPDHGEAINVKQCNK